jgi:hypothetical protein
VLLCWHRKQKRTSTVQAVKEQVAVIAFSPRTEKSFVENGVLIPNLLPDHFWKSLVHFACLFLELSENQGNCVENLRLIK